jgi:hypothetical protein
MWLLNELRAPQLRAIAAEEAARADLIVIAVHHAQGFPAEAKSWIDLWLGLKGNRPIALLAPRQQIIAPPRAAQRGVYPGNLAGFCAKP